MKRARFEVPEFDLLPLAAKMHLTGENVIETLTREAVNSALAKTGGVQTEAAQLLGLTPRQMQLWTKDLQLRPSDRKMAAIPPIKEQK